MNNNSIGIFDSGLGGLTVLKQISKILPNEHLIYFGDTARVPYGNKSSQTITKYSINIANFLLTKKIKLLIVACNTASAVSLEKIKNHINIPVIDVIKPCVKNAAFVTKNQNIGVIGTQTTINSMAYSKEINKINEKIQIFTQSCPLFVPLIEEGLINDDITELIIKKYLYSIKKSNIDTLILGCTHYPIIASSIENYFEKKINIIDSGLVTAQHIKRHLIENNLFADNTKKNNDFYVSDNHKNFLKIANMFLKTKIKNLKQVSL